MEPSLSRAVVHVFVDLHKKGKLYRGLRMTNWDPEAKTVLSNEEVIYREENAQLFHLRYPLADNPGEGIVIATQRPETIMADVAIAVHPEEEKYRHLIGKMVLIPLINRPIPIIADTYVDREFGTGALKITPAHDQNDHAIGQKHGLPVIDILTEDGKLNENAVILVGEDRFAARKKIRRMLEESGNLVKLEDYRTNIGHSERTDSVVEPRLTRQWFLRMDELSSTALEAVRSGEVRFFPENMWNMYYQWLNEENVRDWCISRQLWWGQRIPAWYIKTAEGRLAEGGEEVVIVAENEAVALEHARLKTGNPALSLSDLEQDEDVVDTWFSSWLWPISVFDGFEDKRELSYYYPTSVLVTGWDIMFFWVARMIMAGYEWSEDLLGKDLKGRMPFHDVYFTGMVRDNKRRKMSKSLGNSPEALELIENYGADGVRFGMLLSGSAGNDIIFDAPFDPKTNTVLNESKLCEQGRNFCNKLWNALRLIKGWQVSGETAGPVNQLAVAWMEQKSNEVLSGLDHLFKQYRLSDALLSLYQLIWDDFCSWYLEMIKPVYLADGSSEALDRPTYEATLAIFERLMSALHPFLPFVSEEIWHQLKERKPGEDCIVSPYPAPGGFDRDLIARVDMVRNAISEIRNTRSNKGVSPREALSLSVQSSDNARMLYQNEGLVAMLCKMANLSDLKLTVEEPEGSIAFISGTEKYFLALNIAIDAEAEKDRLTKELDYYLGFVAGVEQKLSNERFVNNAPEAVVANERKKLADGQEKIRILQEALDKL
jgi:valyl-tRNA synthetase